MQTHLNTVFARQAPYGDAEKTRQAVQALLDELPAFKNLCADAKVLIKPNLLAKSAPENAVTTHPHVVRAVILCLQAKGVKDITVADSPGGPHTQKMLGAVYKASGIADVCQSAGAKLSVDGAADIVAANGTVVRNFSFLQPFGQANFIINLPKMKTHVLTGMSGAVKNLFGLVPGLQKAEFHTRFPEKEPFANMIVDLCQTVNADIHLLDGLLAMEGNGPGGGKPRQCNLLLAGQNPYYVDLAVCHFIGMQPMQTPILAAANKRGLCPKSLPEGALQASGFNPLPIQGFLHPKSYSGKVDFSRNVPMLLGPLVSFIAKASAPKPVIKAKACIGCAKCVHICPQKTVHLQGKKALIQYNKCIKCFCCHEVCPAHAIDVRRTGFFKL